METHLHSRIPRQIRPYHDRAEVHEPKRVILALQPTLMKRPERFHGPVARDCGVFCIGHAGRVPAERPDACAGAFELVDELGRVLIKVCVGHDCQLL